MFDRAMWAPAGRRHSVLAAAALLALCGLLIPPSTTVLALALVSAALIVVLRRPPVAGLVAIVLIAGIGARIVQRQRGERHPANAAWPGFWEKLHGPALVVVMLLVAASVLDATRRRDADR
jgi:TRAP-type C4-dicarboxylate transport system permease large subunit